VVTIDLSKDLRTRNLTPAHELFHIFQNGYTLFKNAWYTEGTARWSESAFRKGTGQAGALPQTAEDLSRLFKLKYDACRFWLAMARETDSVGKLRIPPDLREVSYVGGGGPVIQDDTFWGAAFLKSLLEELDRMDDVASRDCGLNPSGWRDARRKSAENNPYVWAAVMNVCRRFQTQSVALERMVNALSAGAAPQDLE